MSDLDKKLEETVTLSIAKYAYADNDNFVPVKDICDDAINEIKQAFIDEGWKHDGFSQAVEYMYKKREEGVKPTWLRIGGVEFMTGQEWYDKFYKEAKLQFPHLDDSKFTSYGILDAAKKAASIE